MASWGYASNKRDDSDLRSKPFPQLNVTIALPTLYSLLIYHDSDTASSVQSKFRIHQHNLFESRSFLFNGPSSRRDFSLKRHLPKREITSLGKREARPSRRPHQRASINGNTNDLAEGVNTRFAASLVDSLSDCAFHLRLAH
jgi:hypothetical protein